MPHAPLHVTPPHRPSDPFFPPPRPLIPPACRPRREGPGHSLEERRPRLPSTASVSCSTENTQIGRSVSPPSVSTRSRRNLAPGHHKNEAAEHILPSCGRRRSATHIHRCCSCSRHNIDDGVIVAGSSRAQYRGNAQLTLGKSPGALGMRGAKASRCPSTSPGRTNGSAFLCADPTRAYAIVRLSTIAQAPRRELDYEPDAAEATFFRSTWLSACLRVSIVTPLPFNSTMNRSGMEKTRIVPDLLSLSYSSTPLKPL